MREPLRPIEWTGNAVRVIDQTELPGRLVRMSLESVEQLVDAIQRLAVRGDTQAVFQGQGWGGSGGEHCSGSQREEQEEWKECFHGAWTVRR